MEKQLNAKFTIDEATATLHIERSFTAPKTLVWKAYSTPELLDQWWAPKPWKTETNSMDFRSGGKWLYAMVGPEGERHNCMAAYLEITPEDSIIGKDAFCDEDWNLNEQFPVASISIRFEQEGSQTHISVSSSYDSMESLQVMMDMGMREGFDMALDNLEELLKELA